VVINSTISNNRSNYSAGIESRGVLTLTNSTVSGNAAREGGGLVVKLMVHNDGVSMSKTILAGNTAEEGPDCLGMVSSLGHNLIGIDSDCEFIPSERDAMGTERRHSPSTPDWVAWRPTAGQQPPTPCFLGARPSTPRLTGPALQWTEGAFHGHGAVRATSGPSSGNFLPQARYPPGC